jgi:hypothetical protein
MHVHPLPTSVIALDDLATVTGASGNTFIYQPTAVATATDRGIATIDQSVSDIIQHYRASSSTFSLI